MEKIKLEYGMKLLILVNSIDKSGKFGVEKIYSSDLVSLIEGGTIKIIN